jgi:hypothetical protein
LFLSNEFGHSALKQAILPKLARRFAAEATAKTLGACGQMIEESPEQQLAQMLDALDQG